MYGTSRASLRQIIIRRFEVLPRCHLSSSTLPPTWMPPFLYNVENDKPSSQLVFEVSQTPQSSTYLDLPLVPVRRNPSSHDTSFIDFSPNAQQKKQGHRSNRRWPYSRLDNSRANKFESVHSYQLERIDDPISALDAPYPLKPTSLPDTPNYNALDEEMTLLKTPSPSFFRRLTLTKPLRKHPFSKLYEVPEWISLLIHTFLCVVSYPVLVAFVQIVKGRTLFWTRVIVGIGSGITGVLLGRSLLQLSRRHLEATGVSLTISPARDADRESNSLGHCNTPITKSRSSRCAIQAYRETCRRSNERL